MRILIRKLLAPILSRNARQKLKKLEYDFRRFLIGKLPSLSEADFQRIITERLGVRSGDHVFVHGSLDMMNTSVSPLRLVEILLGIVGDEGSVSAPTFIRYTSKEWMQMDKPFHVTRTPSGMGLLSERIRRYPGSKRSLHPTKSVSTIGTIADDVLGEHHLSEYPFGSQSPFMKLLKYNVKVIGLGVPMSYLSMVHTVEDCNPTSYPTKVNESEIYEKTCIGPDGKEYRVKSLVHNTSVIVKANPERFVKKYVPAKAFHIERHYLTPFFVVDGKQLYQTLEEQMKLGRTIYD